MSTTLATPGPRSETSTVPTADDPVAALRASHAELICGQRAMLQDALELATLRAAVGHTAELTEALADIARHLATRAEQLRTSDDLRDSRDSTVPPSVTLAEISVDLRTVANHLSVASLLLDPALDDLAHLQPPDAEPNTANP
jgi:hypothetical protein